MVQIIKFNIQSSKPSEIWNRSDWIYIVGKQTQCVQVIILDLLGSLIQSVTNCRGVLTKPRARQQLQGVRQNCFHFVLLLLISQAYSKRNRIFLICPIHAVCKTVLNFYPCCIFGWGKVTFWCTSASCNTLELHCLSEFQRIKFKI